MLTLQQTFDKAVGGVLKQGRHARSSANRSCRYRLLKRGKVFAKCAVGQLIDDAFYDKKMEGLIVAPFYLKPVDETKLLAIYDVLAQSGVPMQDRTLEMLDALQLAHDNTYTMTDFADRCENIARRFGLNDNACKG